MVTVRVLLTSLPALQAGVVRELVAQEPDLDVIGEVGRPDDVRAVVERTRPDVVLVVLAAADFVSAAVALLRDLPWLRLVGLADGPRAPVVEARVLRSRPGGWPAELLAALRGAGGADGPVPVAGRNRGGAG
jgi:DNA-binding NarL/FixJ family response regulator